MYCDFLMQEVLILGKDHKLERKIEKFDFYPKFECKTEKMEIFRPLHDIVHGKLHTWSPLGVSLWKHSPLGQSLSVIIC